MIIIRIILDEVLILYYSDKKSRSINERPANLGQLSLTVALRQLSNLIG